MRKPFAMLGAGDAKRLQNYYAKVVNASSLLDVNVRSKLLP